MSVADLIIRKSKDKAECCSRRATQAGSGRGFENHQLASLRSRRSGGELLHPCGGRSSKCHPLSRRLSTIESVSPADRATECARRTWMSSARCESMTAVRNLSCVAGSRVPFPPPLACFAGLALGFGIQYFHPLRIVRSSESILAGQIIGVSLLTISVVLVTYTIRAFRKAKTTHTFGRPSTALIVRGPFRFTRNPVYLSAGLSHAGVAFLANSLWPLLLLAPALAVVNSLIRREEQYLNDRFGTEFEAYCRSVRRWL